jgi:hypothetical protein
MVLLCELCSLRLVEVCAYVRAWYVLHTVFFVPEATKDGKIVKPAVQEKDTK